MAFDQFVFDTESRELRRSGQPVRLAPKAFSLLEILLRQRPRAVSRADLQDEIWPDTIVTESGLAKLANEVRNALGDSARAARYLRTVHGFGFAFGAEATEETGAAGPPSWCRLLWGDRVIPLPEGETVLGRAPDAGVWIDSTKVSRRHAHVRVSGTRAEVEDLGSKNGTYVRGKLVRQAVVLVDGDDIRVGPATLIFQAIRGSGSTETDHSR